MNCEHCGYRLSPSLRSCVGCRRPVAKQETAAQFQGNPSILPWLVGIVVLVAAAGFGTRYYHQWTKDRAVAAERSTWNGRSLYGGNLEVAALRISLRHAQVRLVGHAKNIGPRDVRDALITVQIDGATHRVHLGPIAAGETKGYTKALAKVGGGSRFWTLQLKWVELEPEAQAP